MKPEIMMKRIRVSLLAALWVSILCGCAGQQTGIPADADSGPAPSAAAESLMESRVVRLTLGGGHMGRDIPFMLYLPKGYGGGDDYPVFYGLHGYSANEKQWIDTVGIADAADRLIESGEIKPLIMVFPLTRYDTMKEIQEDAEDGIWEEDHMDRFLCRELVPYIDSNYDTITSSDGRYIGGFSMGGMIALRIALHHTELFGKVGGYTPAVPSSDYSDKQLERWLFPNDDIEDIHDVAAFAREHGFDRLQVYLNCGDTNDPFAPGVQSLYEALQMRGVKTQFEVFEGGHDIHNIMDDLDKHLKFYCGME